MRYNDLDPFSGEVDELELPPNLLMYAPGGLMWMDNERQRLFNSYGVVDTGTLRILFPNRSLQSLKTQACLLKIPRPKQYYSKLEDQLLLDLRSGGLSFPKIAKHFSHRTSEGIRRRYNRIKNIR